MRRRTAATVLAVFTGLCGARTAAALEAPRKVVDYTIEATLDPARRVIDGREVLRWTNPSADRVPTLMFHLYWNAFRNNRSTFFKESGGKLRGDEADKEKGWGSIDVTSMTWEGKELKGSFRFVSPDDGNTDDRTVLRVDLPRPVEPGETVELKVAWTSRVPRVFARAGYVRDFFMVGQWYPKIAVYEPVGRRRRETSGWNAHQYHANSEFYADWGDYRVSITLPEKFVVGSAGALVSETKAKGLKTLTYEQKSIHDFAWTADPRYVVKEDLFDPAKDVPKDELARAAKVLGRPESELLAAMKPVKLRFYMQPDHAPQWVRYAEAQKWALAWFGLWAFPYPYAQVSCVDPPEDGAGAGGMEYQTIYTAGTAKVLGRWPLDKLRFPEMVVVHEFGHGYWMGLVASNEFEESWMDEGINSFTEYEMVDRKWGAIVELPFGARLADFDMGRLAVGTHPEVDPIVAAAWRYSTGESYAHNSYPRPAAVMGQIRRLLGEEAFWRAFRGYAERWRFDHPSSDDFLDGMRAAASGRSIGRLVENEGEAAFLRSFGSGGGGSTTATAAPTAQAAPPRDRDRRRVDDLVAKTFRGTGAIDVRIVSAVSRRLDEFTGYDDARKAVNFTEKAAAGDKADKAREEKEAKAAREKKEKEKKAKDAEAKKKGTPKGDAGDDPKRPWESVVVVGRTGDISLPAEVVLTFANGRIWRTTWDGEDTWVRYRTVYPSRLVKAEVDPSRDVVLDRNPWNNARILPGYKGPSAAAKVRAYVTHALQILSSSLWPLV